MAYRVIELTEGNIRNNHLYLSRIMDFFPPNSIGGSNLSSQASQLLEVDYGAETPVITDIAGDKKIFRKRGWVKDFFIMNQLKMGDKVVIEHVGDCKYKVYPQD